MSRSAFARGRLALGGALALLGATGAIASCSPAPNHTDTSTAGQSSQTGGGGGGGGGGDSAGGSDAVSIPTKPVHSTRGKRGTGCTVKNDCANGLSCVRGICELASFGLTPSAKECVQIDCVDSADCCGGLPTEIPEACRSRAAFCLKDLPGCEPNECTRSSECAGGGVCTGHCLISSGECSGNVDCLANKCLGGACSINFTACTSDAECAANTCGGGTCACQNPAYSPTKPVCADEACDGLCLWACESSRCVIPTQCDVDDDCFGAKPLCVEGECVECTESPDCSFGKTCREGSCETPCENDANCGLFEACQTGECIYVGCRSDRECSLIPDVNALQLAPGFDPRLLRCHTDAGVGRCLIPCQTDSQCAPTEICSGGLCKYIGCEASGECKTIIGVHDQVTSNDQPWIPAVECRAIETTKKPGE